MIFNDLKFEPHPLEPYFNKQARYDFPNGYGISVISGDCAHCDKNTYEVAIFKDGQICYDTELTDDTLSYQTIDAINNILKVLESYEPTIQESNFTFY